MDLTTVHTLYGTLADARWGLLYSGDFHDEHSARLIMLAEGAVKASPAPATPISKKIAFVLVEAYQNVIRHRAPLSKELERSLGRSMLMLRSDGRSYEVATMNPIRQKEEREIEVLLDGIRKNTDRKQLKEMFLRGLQSGSSSNRGGAGLGLIEMARRSSSGLRHEISSLSDAEMMFTIQLRVGSSGMAPSSMAQVHDLQEAMAGSDMLLLFKGEFSSAIQTALMKIISTDLDGRKDRSDARARAFLAAMEMQAEIPEQEGDPMVVIGREGNDHALVVGLLVDQRHAERSARQVEILQAMDHNARQKLYRDALLGRDPDGAFTSTGLLDLARRSKAPLQMALFPQGASTLLLLKALV